jgi:hypothetical protein
VKKTIAQEKAKSAFSGSLTLDSRGASINPGQLTLDSHVRQLTLVNSYFRSRLTKAPALLFLLRKSSNGGCE